MLAMWKRELLGGNSCPEFVCADTLMEFGGFDVFYSFICSSIQVTASLFKIKQM